MSEHYNDLAFSIFWQLMDSPQWKAIWTHDVVNREKEVLRERWVGRIMGEKKEEFRLLIFDLYKVKSFIRQSGNSPKQFEKLINRWIIAVQALKECSNCNDIEHCSLISAWFNLVKMNVQPHFGTCECDTIYKTRHQPIHEIIIIIQVSCVIFEQKMSPG